MRTYLLLVLASAALVSCRRQVEVGSPAATASPVRDPEITSADQLLSAMHDRYAGRWYRNLTFIQKSSFFRPDGSTLRVETWYESASMPGKLRIDLGDPSAGNGVLYRADSIYSIQGGRIADRRAGRNPLMVLGFDVYAQPPSRTFQQVSAEGIDVSVLRTDTLYGRRVYVVGAGPADFTSNQFWVDAERLLFVRLIQTDTVRRRTQDTRFERYVQHGGGWVAEEVRFLIDGRLLLHEDYSNVRVNVPLDDRLFVPEQWSTATHWFKP